MRAVAKQRVGLLTVPDWAKFKASDVAYAEPGSIFVLRGKLAAGGFVPVSVVAGRFRSMRPVDWKTYGPTKKVRVTEKGGTKYIEEQAIISTGEQDIAPPPATAVFWVEKKYLDFLPEAPPAPRRRSLLGALFLAAVALGTGYYCTKAGE